MMRGIYIGVDDWCNMMMCVYLLVGDWCKDDDEYIYIYIIKDLVTGVKMTMGVYICIEV